MKVRPSRTATRSPATKSCSQPPPSRRSTTPGCRRHPDRGNSSFCHSSRRRREGEGPPQSLQEGDRRQRRRLWGGGRAGQGFPLEPHPRARPARPATGDDDSSRQGPAPAWIGTDRSGAELLHGAMADCEEPPQRLHPQPPRRPCGRGRLPTSARRRSPLHKLHRTHRPEPPPWGAEAVHRRGGARSLPPPSSGPCTRAAEPLWQRRRKGRGRGNTVAALGWAPSRLRGGSGGEGVF